jgi:hypothetical protein
MTAGENTRDFVLLGVWNDPAGGTLRVPCVIRLSQYDVESEQDIINLIDSVSAAGFDIERLQFEMLGPWQRNAEYSSTFLGQLGERGIRFSIETREGVTGST